MALNTPSPEREQTEAPAIQAEYFVASGAHIRESYTTSDYKLNFSGFFKNYIPNILGRLAEIGVDSRAGLVEFLRDNVHGIAESTLHVAVSALMTGKMLNALAYNATNKTVFVALSQLFGLDPKNEYKKALDELDDGTRAKWIAAFDQLARVSFGPVVSTSVVIRGLTDEPVPVHDAGDETIMVDRQDIEAPISALNNSASRPPSSDNAKLEELAQTVSRLAAAVADIEKQMGQRREEPDPSPLASLQVHVEQLTNRIADIERQLSERPDIPEPPPASSTAITLNPATVAALKTALQEALHQEFNTYAEQSFVEWRREVDADNTLLATRHQEFLVATKEQTATAVTQAIRGAAQPYMEVLHSGLSEMESLRAQADERHNQIMAAVEQLPGVVIEYLASYLLNVNSTFGEGKTWGGEVGQALKAIKQLSAGQGAVDVSAIAQQLAEQIAGNAEASPLAALIQPILARTVADTLKPLIDELSGVANRAAHDESQWRADVSAALTEMRTSVQSLPASIQAMDERLMAAPAAGPESTTETIEVQEIVGAPTAPEELILAISDAVTAGLQPVENSLAELTQVFARFLQRIQNGQAAIPDAPGNAQEQPEIRNRGTIDAPAIQNAGTIAATGTIAAVEEADKAQRVSEIRNAETVNPSVDPNAETIAVTGTIELAVAAPIADAPAASEFSDEAPIAGFEYPAATKIRFYGGYSLRGQPLDELPFFKMPISEIIKRLTSTFGVHYVSGLDDYFIDNNPLGLWPDGHGYQVVFDRSMLDQDADATDPSPAILAMSLGLDPYEAYKDVLSQMTAERREEWEVGLNHWIAKLTPTYRAIAHLPLAADEMLGDRPGTEIQNTGTTVAKRVPEAAEPTRTDNAQAPVTDADQTARLAAAQAGIPEGAVTRAQYPQTGAPLNSYKYFNEDIPQALPAFAAIGFSTTGGLGVFLQDNIPDLSRAATATFMSNFNNGKMARDADTGDVASRTAATLPILLGLNPHVFYETTLSRLSPNKRGRWIDAFDQALQSRNLTIAGPFIESASQSPEAAEPDPSATGDEEVRGDNTIEIAEGAIDPTTATTLPGTAATPLVPSTEEPKTGDKDGATVSDDAAAIREGEPKPPGSAEVFASTATATPNSLAGIPVATVIREEYVQTGMPLSQTYFFSTLAFHNVTTTFQRIGVETTDGLIDFLIDNNLLGNKEDGIARTVNFLIKTSQEINPQIIGPKFFAAIAVTLGLGPEKEFEEVLAKLRQGPVDTAPQWMGAFHRIAHEFGPKFAERRPDQIPVPILEETTPLADLAREIEGEGGQAPEATLELGTLTITDDAPRPDTNVGLDFARTVATIVTQLPEPPRIPEPIPTAKEEPLLAASVSSIQNRLAGIPVKTLIRDNYTSEGKSLDEISFFDERYTDGFKATLERIGVKTDEAFMDIMDDNNPFQISDQRMEMQLNQIMIEPIQRTTEPRILAVAAVILGLEPSKVYAGLLDEVKKVLDSDVRNRWESSFNGISYTLKKNRGYADIRPAASPTVTNEELLQSFRRAAEIADSSGVSSLTSTPAPSLVEAIPDEAKLALAAKIREVGSEVFEGTSTGSGANHKNLETEAADGSITFGYLMKRYSLSLLPEGHGRSEPLTTKEFAEALCNLPTFANADENTRKEAIPIFVSMYNDEYPPLDPKGNIAPFTYLIMEWQGIPSAEMDKVPGLEGNILLTDAMRSIHQDGLGQQIVGAHLFTRPVLEARLGYKLQDRDWNDLSDLLNSKDRNDILFPTTRNKDLLDILTEGLSRREDPSPTSGREGPRVR